jgi:hypothetical protein
MVVKEVMAALGLMLFGIVVLIGTAPSPSVALASVLVIPVILLGSAMLKGRRGIRADDDVGWVCSATIWDGSKEEIL